ncbi:MAG: coagulation factor 5/8 type domain protein [Glaciihabitans sp.]|nr:coagulation factor 5/8 type domain protein [Glaciihabitans sp.]
MSPAWKASLGSAESPAVPSPSNSPSKSPSKSPTGSPGRRRTALFAAVVLAAGTAIAVGFPSAAQAATGGSGATLPYVEQQAEAAATNGTIIGPSYTQGQLADEASDRKAVTLSGQGKYVEFTLTQPTNSIDVRYSIPDTSGGSVYTAPLSLYVGGTKQADLSLTNAYSWYYSSYPFSNSPSGGLPQHFYDEVHRLLGATYPAGTKIRLQVDAGDTASTYTIDLADFEQVGAAGTQPAGSTSVVTYGADPTGAADSTSAFQQAVNAAAGGTVWIPAGTFKVTQHIIVNNVTVTGAGMWYSTVSGDGVGFYGNYAPNPSSNVHLSNFAIVGNVQERNDGAQVNGIGGAMSNSTVSNIWIEHEKVGAWMDGPMDNLKFNGMRIRDTTADGVNFHDGVTNSSVTNSDLRTLGDDGLATWSDTNADANDSFSNDTVQLNQLGNGIAIYGGHDNTVSGNLVVDDGINQGGGIHVAQRFASTTLGKTTVSGNTIIRSGDLDPNWQFGVGALWFDARDAAMAGDVEVSNTIIQQSPFEAVQFVSGSSITNVHLTDVKISGTGTFAVQKQVGGSATFTNVVATGVNGPAGTYDCGVGFTINDGGGNSGYSTTYCGPWPTPVYPPDGGTPPPPTGPDLEFTPSSLTFGNVNVGSSSASQAATLTNQGTATATISGITKSGDYSQTNNCGTSLAVGATCTVTATFTPTASGARSGQVSVASNAANSPATLALSGSGVDSTTNLAAGRPATSSSSNSSYVASNVTDGNTSSYWESANGAFPQWAQVDLGASTSVNKVTLNLPPATAWSTRTQTLSVQGSTDGSSFSNLVGSSTYTFDPATGNTVTIPFTAANARYVRINITANSGWAAGQLSELQVFGGGGTTPPPTNAILGFTPGSLAFGSVNVGTSSATQASVLKNTGTATATISSIAASGDFSQTNNCGSSLAVGASCTVTAKFTPSTPGGKSGNVTVTSNATGSPTVLALSGTGASTTPANLAAGKTATSSSSTDVYVASNVTDSSTSSYWESANNVFPQWVQVDLGAATGVSKITLDLPPATSWATRSQTLSVQGSTDGSTFTTLVGSASYTFNPATGNTVTITFTSASERYVRLNITANTGWPAGQISDFQIYS